MSSTKTIKLNGDVINDLSMTTSVTTGLYVPWYSNLLLGYESNDVEIIEEFLDFSIMQAISFCGGFLSGIRWFCFGTLTLILSGFVLPCFGDRKFFGYEKFFFDSRMRYQV